MSMINVDYAKLVSRGSVLLTLVLTVLLVVPFSPFVAGLDGEPWRYAMNAAVANHLMFGRDIIFTAGPLSAIYTRAYHPATDSLLLFGSLLLAVALCLGFAAITPARRRPWLLLVPLIISQLPFEGAMLLALPFLFVLVGERAAEGRGRLTLAALYVVAIACTVLPLIKGTMAVAEVACGSLAFLALIRRRPVVAASMVGTCVVVLFGTWLYTGQPLGALPLFFLSQIPVVTGYTVAMAIDGNTWEAITFPFFALAVVVALTGTSVLQRWRVTLASAILLFIAFKAGYVRHDTHPTIAASALALAGLIAFVEKPGVTRKGLLGLLAGFSGAVVTSMAYQSYNVDEMQQRMSAAVADSAAGLVRRMVDPGDLRERFAEENERLRKTFPLPAYTGTADIYPDTTATLLASGATWNPRPAVLSYTAYTPSLAKADADHLRGNPPSRIYFDIGGIDTRYPSLDDGLSWPILLADYRVSGFSGRYAVLDHGGDSGAVHFGPEVTRIVRTGTTIDLGTMRRPVWAKIDIQPTLLGRIASLLYKLPLLTLKTHYEDGSSRLYRFIPGMASEGFLLSPTVADSTAFVALHSSEQQALLAGNYVTQMEVRGETGTRWLWGAEYKLTLQDVDIGPSSSADALLLARPKLQAGPFNPLAGGDCSIDFIDDLPGSTPIVRTRSDLLVVKGWALASGPEAKLAEARDIALIQGDATYLASVRTTPRGDIGIHFQHPDLLGAGFESFIDVRGMHGDFDLRVLQKSGDQVLMCASARSRIHIE
jgi:hypothetical protein